jgi:hypothetical protein
MGDFSGSDVTLAEDGDGVMGDEEMVVADLDEEGEELVEEDEGGEGEEAERVEEGDAGVDVGWLAGVTGVGAGDLKSLPREHLEALAEAAERYENERSVEQAREDEKARMAEFVEAFAEKSGRGMDEVGQMLAEYEDLISAYSGVEDDGARRSLEAMAWAEVVRRHPVEEDDFREEEEVVKKKRAPGRIRKSAAGNRVAGYGGKRRVSLEGSVTGYRD